jgi:hypothetical protein
MMRSLFRLALLAAVVAAGCGDDAAPSVPSSPSSPTSPTQAVGCGRTSVGLTPLSDLGSGVYQGRTGGLYPNGSNARPGPHESEGLSRARAIVPMDRDGRPDPNGRYVLASLGMSNTTQEFSTFKPLADADATRDSHLVVVDGAQGGQTAMLWASPGCACWATLDARLASAGVTAAQVSVIWMKHADAGPTGGFPSHVQTLQNELASILSILSGKFPNLRLVYLSSRIYAGYATSTLNPEPYAYESGFAVKALVEGQISGAAGLAYTPGGMGGGIPWIAWGPYLWADGMTPRRDGLTWACSDLSSSDGTHPSTSGQRKVADMLLAFFQTDSTARAWYIAR